MSNTLKTSLSKWAAELLALGFVALAIPRYGVISRFFFAARRSW
jgi:hypothetical protein